MEKEKEENKDKKLEAQKLEQAKKMIEAQELIAKNIKFCAEEVQAVLDARNCMLHIDPKVSILPKK